MAEEEGPERGEINGGLASSMGSIESRWVFQDEDDSEIDDEDAEEDVRHRTVMDSEDDEEDDNAEQRLIRTGPRIDSFDVEALEVPGAQRNEYELPSDAHISSFRLKVPSPELERSLKIKERLEASLPLKKLLVMLVLAGTSMVIADGVVTPAMSVVSAVGGLKVRVEAIKQDQVMMISVAFLIILFSVQKFGTSKVGLAVGPALFIWFCSLGGIGLYNLVQYDSSVLRAFNPVHIYYFFKRNSTKAWYSLGGCLLCATANR